MKIIKRFILVVCLLGTASSGFAQRKADFYQMEYPKWFSDAKLGIFIHYGLYSVPAWSAPEQYAEWFYKGLISGDTARINFQKRVYGEQFRYEDYKRLFKAELFNADHWAKLFKQSGAKYVIFTAKHHDGYCMYDSRYAVNWNSVTTAPHRDFCKELADAVRKEELKFGLYYSLLEWNNPWFKWTIDSAGIEKYVSNHLKPQFKEMVSKFKPSIVFADGDWDFGYQTLQSDYLVQYYYDKVGEEGIVNNRWGVGFDYGFLTPEYSSGIRETKRPWAECRGLSRSFGLNRNADLSSYMTSEELIEHFVTLVSQGGGLTLNIAPSADGLIPLLQQERLLDLGKWLAINGEAIYGSSPYIVHNIDTICGFETTDSCLDYNWVRNSPHREITEDNFTMYAQCEMTPKESGICNFVVKADDKAVMTISEMTESGFETIVVKDSAVEGKTCEISAWLRADKTYKIGVRYEEKTHDASLSVNIMNKNSLQPFKADWKIRYEYRKPYVYFTQKGDDLYLFADTKFCSDILEVDLGHPCQKGLKITLLNEPKTAIPYLSENHNLILDISNLKCNAQSGVSKSDIIVLKLQNYLRE
ncbi:MAG: alpha-L-fucosidase [Bacteroidales bacterium]|nr:alpha-L-fucosidase [Bacteroidales bacterium]